MLFFSRPWHSTMSRDSLWAICPRLASSGYHAEFHEGCYQKHTNLRCRWPAWNQTMFVMDEEKSGSSKLQKSDLLNCWTCSLDTSGYHVDFHEGHGTIGAWKGCCIGTACYVWIGLHSFTWHCQRKLSGENLICVGSNKETVWLSKIRCGLHHLGKTEVLIKTNHHCSHIRVKVDFIH